MNGLWVFPENHSLSYSFVLFWLALMLGI